MNLYLNSESTREALLKPIKSTSPRRSRSRRVLNATFRRTGGRPYALDPAQSRRRHGRRRREHAVASSILSNVTRMT